MPRGRPSRQHTSDELEYPGSLRNRYMNIYGVPLVPIFVAFAVFVFLFYALSTNQTIFGRQYNLTENESLIYSLIGAAIVGVLAFVLMVIF